MRSGDGAAVGQNGQNGQDKGYGWARVGPLSGSTREQLGGVFRTKVISALNPGHFADAPVIWPGLPAR
ncbi:hypothetical protein [Tritonibacter horizontis]|uniref:Uncharacterized protein n=1 Tax=Tritonibacter horizontis TaxID=1768241 RepID=A0A132BX90_9RHOB|nr:hypothetical protein [Tritonibacter horizontis]KUP93009.1 hypothetical protein TRIHO_21320 [Tritonibacter horizontis]